MGLETDDPSNRNYSENEIEKECTHYNDDKFNTILSHFSFNLFTYAVNEILKDNKTNELITFGSFNGENTPKIYLDKNALNKVLNTLSDGEKERIANNYFKTIQTRVTPSKDKEFNAIKTIAFDNKKQIITNFNMGMSNINDILTNKSDLNDNTFTYNDFRSYSGFTFSSALFSQRMKPINTNVLKTLPNVRDSVYTSILKNSEDHKYTLEKMENMSDFIVTHYISDISKPIYKIPEYSKYASIYYKQNFIIILGMVRNQQHTFPIGGNDFYSDSDSPVNNEFNGDITYTIIDVKDLNGNTVVSHNCTLSSNSSKGLPVKLTLDTYKQITVKVSYEINNVIKYSKNILITSISDPRPVSNIIIIENTTEHILLSWELMPEHNYGIKIYRDDVDLTPNDSRGIGIVTRYKDTNISSGNTYIYKIIALFKAPNGATFNSDPKEISVTAI